jgi:hypothetical protein
MIVRPSRIRTGQHLFPLFGGFVGLVAWSLVALMPSLVHGGFAGWSLAHGVLGGHAAEGSLLERLSIAFGMLVGSLGVAAVFVVLGAVGGAALWALKEIVLRRRTPGGPVEVLDVGNGGTP